MNAPLTNLGTLDVLGHELLQRRLLLAQALRRALRLLRLALPARLLQRAAVVDHHQEVDLADGVFGTHQLELGPLQEVAEIGGV